MSSCIAWCEFAAGAYANRRSTLAAQGKAHGLAAYPRSWEPRTGPARCIVTLDAKECTGTVVSNPEMSTAPLRSFVRLQRTARGRAFLNHLTSDGRSNMQDDAFPIRSQRWTSAIP